MICKLGRNVERNLTTEDNPTYVEYHPTRQPTADMIAYRICTHPSE